MRQSWTVALVASVVSCFVSSTITAFHLPHPASRRAHSDRSMSSAFRSGTSSCRRRSLPQQNQAGGNPCCRFSLVGAFDSTESRNRGYLVVRSSAAGRQDDDPNADGEIRSISEKPEKRKGRVQAATAKLKEYGLAGILAYGAMNQLYYSMAFATLWLGPMGAAAVAPPAGAGLGAKLAVSWRQFAKVMALVWVGSQATKPLRYLLALFFAPAAEVALNSTQKRLQLPSRQRTFFLLCAALLSTTASFCTAAVFYATLRAAAVSTSATSATVHASSSIVSGLSLGRFGVRQEALFSRSGEHDGKEGTRTRPGDVLQGFSLWGVKASTERVYSRRTVLRRMADSGATIDEGMASGPEETQRVATMSDAAGILAGGLLRPESGERTVEDQTGSPGSGLTTGSANSGFDAQDFAATVFSSSPSMAEQTTERQASEIRKRRNRKKRITPQKAADLNPPPQDNIHGWNEHPNHLLGFWTVHSAEALPSPQADWTPEAVAAAAPSVAAAAALAEAAASHSSAGMSSDDQQGHSIPQSSGKGSRRQNDVSDAAAYALESEGGFGDRETAEEHGLDLGSDILHHINYVVFKRDGSFKAGPARLGIVPRTWRFAPANRRILFEVDVPGRGICLRYTAKLTRLPGRFTFAQGIIRTRSMSEAVGHTELPRASRSWPKLAAFDMTMQLKTQFRHNDGRQADRQDHEKRPGNLRNKRRNRFEGEGAAPARRFPNFQQNPEGWR